MRSFRFIAKNLGRERYLTHIMGEGMEVDEDVLDFCEENEIDEIINIIYEEDDEYDYLTYDVTGRMSIDKYSQGVMDREKVLKLLRNVALGMISIKEHAIPLSYIILNREFMYIDPDTMKIKFLYLPVESDASLSTEFKSFVRQLVAGFIYNVDEDLSYVGQLLTYINGNGFNLRGLIGLCEALMKDAGISFNAEDGIEADDGTEIINDAPLDEGVEEKGAMNFMDDLGAADDKLPEIGDDGDEADDIDVSAEPESEPETEPEPEPVPVTAAESVTPIEEETVDDIKARIIEMIEEDNKAESVSMQKPVKVNRAAVLKHAAETLEEEEIAAAPSASEAVEQISEESRNAKEKKKKDKIEEAPDADANAKKVKQEVIDNTILGNTGTIVINPYLVRVNTEEKIVINKPVFKIGKASRGVDYHIGGNGAISRQHAVILHKGDQFFIKDNKSTNHTYVDNVQLEGDEEVQLKNNCIITLGDEDFQFKIS